jgi:hypothetical protein
VASAVTAPVTNLTAYWRRDAASLLGRICHLRGQFPHVRTADFVWPASPPRTILLENVIGNLIKRSFPPADPQGKIMIVLDEKIASDRASYD